LIQYYFQNEDQFVITTQISHCLTSGDIIRIEGTDTVPESVAGADLLVEVVSDTQFYAIPSGTGGPSPDAFASNPSHVKLVAKSDSQNLKYVSSILH
jgi:hypothetical protein